MCNIESVNGRIAIEYNCEVGIHFPYLLDFHKSLIATFVVVVITKPHLVKNGFEECLDFSIKRGNWVVPVELHHLSSQRSDFWIHTLRRHREGNLVLCPDKIVLIRFKERCFLIQEANSRKTSSKPYTLQTSMNFLPGTW